MISLQQVRNFFFIPCLTAILSLSIAFGLAVPSSFAASLDLSIANQAQHQLVAAFWDKAQGGLKDAEGKAQEAFGDVTDSPKNQAIGKGKQAEGQVRGAAADLKGKMNLDGKAERVKAASKTVEGKAQSAMGDITGDLGDQISGKLKQVEGQARSSAEDMKDFAKDMLD